MQTLWYHDPHFSQLIQSITATLPSSMMQFADWHGSFSWSSSSSFWTLACWGSISLMARCLVFRFFWVGSCFFARSFSFFLWRFRADLLVKSLPHSGQSNSASRNALFLSAMEHCIMAILSSFRFEAVVLAFVTFPQVSFCGSRLASISIFPLLVEASLKECFVMPIVIFVFGRCRQPKLKLVKMVVKIFR